jgi:hypothetical protein
MQHSSSNLWRKKLFFLEHAGELRIFILRKGWGGENPQNNTYDNRATHSSNTLWRKRLKRETTFPCCCWLELELELPLVLELLPPPDAVAARAEKPPRCSLRPRLDGPQFGATYVALLSCNGAQGPTKLKP